MISEQITPCNKNTCGLGKYVGNSYVCPHKNLLVLYPELCKEWDYDKNLKLPESYSSGSSCKVSWICLNNPCGCHQWEASITDRTGRPNKKGSGCPYCSNRKQCEHKNLLISYPELCKEWDYEKNEFGPEKYAPHSNHKAFWVCINENNKCGCHKWCAIINSRTGICETNCPYCSNQELCEHNNLTITHPELYKEWDYDKNDSPPSLYSYGSKKKVWWICPKDPCGCHKYEASMLSRTGDKPSNCPFCSSTFKIVCKHNNILISHPELCKEWDYSKNLYGPENYLPGSEKKVWWKCVKNHEWESIVGTRTLKIKPTGCPSCCLSRQYSKAQIEWLDLIMKQENIKIQYALNTEGEYRIKGIGKVDGYCHETNTVYEYHGSFFHGNPNIYNPEDINPLTHKSYGELYQKTIEKENKIKELGFNLIVKWDKDSPTL